MLVLGLLRYMASASQVPQVQQFYSQLKWCCCCCQVVLGDQYADPFLFHVIHILNSSKCNIAHSTHLGTISAFTPHGTQLVFTLMALN
jgi:hypothetical protein